MNPDEPSTELHEVTRAHIESFNYFLEQGKDDILQYLQPVTLFDASQKAIMTVKVKKVTFDKPKFRGQTLLPFECRFGSLTYAGAAHVTYSVSQDGLEKEFTVNAGDIPIMVGSSMCWIGSDYTTPKQRVEMREDPHEIGGYFIINGVDKFLRMIIYAKPNHPIAVCRPSWANKGARFTKYGIMIRSMRKDMTTQTNTLHFLDNGKVSIRFIYRQQEFFIPVVLLLRIFGQMSDAEIYKLLIMEDYQNSNLVNAAEMLVRREKGSPLNALNTRETALAFIGQKFRFIIPEEKTMTDMELGKKILDDFILVHLSDDSDKANLIIFMLQKLFSFVHGDIDDESVDTPMNQGILLPGHLYQNVFKEELQNALNRIKVNLTKDYHNEKKRDKMTEKSGKKRKR